MPRLSDEQLNDIRRYLLAGNTISVPWAIVSLSDTLNTIDALKADLDTARAECAAMLEKAAEHVPSTATDAHEAWLVCSCGMQSFGKGVGWKEWWSDHIRALITADQAAALREHDGDLRDSVIATCEAMLAGDTNRPEYQKFMKAVAERERKAREDEFRDTVVMCTSFPPEQMKELIKNRAAELRATAERGK